jgi:hypothetical protein
VKLTPVVGGIAGALVAGAGTIILGNVSNVEAMVLVDAILPSTRFLCSSIMTAAATILALLLTSLGFAQGIDVKLKAKTYERMRRLALIDSVALIGSVLVLLLLLNVPMEKTETVPTWWYSAAYYAIIGSSAVLGGLLISIVLLLYETIKGLTLLVGSGTSPLRKHDEDEEQQQDEDVSSPAGSVSHQPG